MGHRERSGKSEVKKQVRLIRGLENWKIRELVKSFESQAELAPTGHCDADILAAGCEPVLSLPLAPSGRDAPGGGAFFLAFHQFIKR
jgi:hypothetical protein